MSETAVDAKPVAPIGTDALIAGALLLAGAIVFLWYAPASYQIYLALHILAVTVWVGGDITLTTLGIVFEAKRDGPTLAALGRMGTWIGTRVYTPALFFVFGFGVALVEKSGLGWNHFWIIFGIVFEQKQDGPTLAALGRMGTWIGTRIYTPTLFFVLGFGVALVEKSGTPWDEFWVVFGVVGWALAMTIGITFVGPELGRIDRAAQEFGPESAEVARRVKRLFTIFRFDTAVLALVVIDMAAKPSF